MAAKKSTTKNVQTPDDSVFDVSDVITPEVANPYHTKKMFLLGGIILTIIVILLLGLYYYLQYQHAQALLKNPTLASEMEQQSVISRVGKLTPLPQGEVPTIAKVSDITKLQNQPFFQHAKNGDYVLLYSKANEAILYDPVSNKIVEVSPMSIKNPSFQNYAIGSSHPTPTDVTVALYNGTTIQGLTRKIQAELAQKMSNVTVVENNNAKSQAYTQTIVIDLTGIMPAQASQLANVLGGSVGKLPIGETAPTDAELMVILGVGNK